MIETMMSFREPAKARYEAAVMTALPTCASCARQARLAQSMRTSDFVTVQPSLGAGYTACGSATCNCAAIGAADNGAGGCRRCGSAAGRAILHSPGVSLPGVEAMRRSCRVPGTPETPEPEPEPQPEPEPEPEPVPPETAMPEPMTVNVSLAESEPLVRFNEG